MAAERSIPRQKSRSERSGHGIDFEGNAVIDPTANVMALVAAESKYQEAMLTAVSRYQDGMRLAEQRRLDDLTAQRVMFEGRISEILTVQVKTTSELISTQLDKVTTALGTQITTSVNSLLDRIGQLERFRWEVGGRTSVQDPAMTAAIASMTSAIATLQASSQEGRGRTSIQDPATASTIAAMASAIAALQASSQENRGRVVGQGEIIGYIFAAITITGIIAATISHLHF